MYIVDFGNTALSLLRICHRLPTISPWYGEIQKAKKYSFRWDICEKEKFARYNVTTLEMYNASGIEIMPAIVVVIDNYDVIKEI